MSDAQAEPREAPAQEKPARPNMSRRTARLIVVAIIALCLLALVFIFQPVYRPLYSAGCVMVVAGGLLFNLIPLRQHAEPGAPRGARHRHRRRHPDRGRVHRSRIRRNPALAVVKCMNAVTPCRHARTRSGHPRSLSLSREKLVDGRTSPAMTRQRCNGRSFPVPGDDPKAPRQARRDDERRLRGPGGAALLRQRHPCRHSRRGRLLHRRRGGHDLPRRCRAASLQGSARSRRDPAAALLRAPASQLRGAVHRVRSLRGRSERALRRDLPRHADAEAGFGLSRCRRAALAQLQLLPLPGRADPRDDHLLQQPRHRRRRGRPRRAPTGFPQA